MSPDSRRKARMFLAGVGDQALSSAGFAMLRMVSRCQPPPDTLRVAPGGLRERLTFRRWRIDQPLGGGLARRPTLRTKPQAGAAYGRRRHPAGERPSEAATGSSRRIVNRVRRCSPVIERIADAIAGPGEAGWNPVDAHTRKTILPIALRSHRRGCPPARGPSPSQRHRS